MRANTRKTSMKKSVNATCKSKNCQKAVRLQIVANEMIPVKPRDALSSIPVIKRNIIIIFRHYKNLDNINKPRIILVRWSFEKLGIYGSIKKFTDIIR